MYLHITHLGDAQGIRDRVGELFEELDHLVRGFEIDFGGIFHPVLVHEEGSGPDADHDVVRVVVGLIEKMHIIRRDEAEPEFSSELPHLPRAGGLLGKAMVVNFEEKAIFAEDVDEFPEALPSPVEVFVLDELIHLSVDAAAQTNEPLGVRGEGFFVDAGFVVHALKVTEAGQLHEIRVADIRRGEQGDMGIAFPLRLASDRDGLGFFVGQGDSRRREVGLAADDRLDPRFFGLLVEIDRPENVAMIRHRHRRHLAALRLFHQVLDPHRPVEEGVFGVQMKVNEGIGRHQEDGRQG